MITFVLVLISLAVGIVIGFYYGQKVVQKNAVLDAIIDATSKEVKDNIAHDAANKDFSIEYYPLTKRYYPMYKNCYLKKDNDTGIMEKKEAYLFQYSAHFSTEKEARDYIELAKEHFLKINVLKIKI